MKRAMVILAVLACTVPALAQLAGLPIAGGADGMAAGGMRASGGLVLGDDFNLYGVRGTFAPIENLALFGDAGLIDPDMGDMGWALQGGGLFMLPLGLPVDVGVRGALGFGGFDADIPGVDATATLTTINGGVLASKKIEMITPYAFAGLNYAKTKVEIDGADGDASDDETDLAIAGGATVSLNEQISFYGEIAYIDDPFFGAGMRFDF